MISSCDSARPGRLKEISTYLPEACAIAHPGCQEGEIGSWKSELQLQVHFGGADQPEAVRQATNYIGNCKLYEDRCFNVCFP